MSVLNMELRRIHLKTIPYKEVFEDFDFSEEEIEAFFKCIDIVQEASSSDANATEAIIATVKELSCDEI